MKESMESTGPFIKRGNKIFQFICIKVSYLLKKRLTIPNIHREVLSVQLEFRVALL